MSAFKLVVQFNTLKNQTTGDDGTWRVKQVVPRDKDIDVKDGGDILVLASDKRVRVGQFIDPVKHHTEYLDLHARFKWFNKIRIYFFKTLVLSIEASTKSKT